VRKTWGRKRGGLCRLPYPTSWLKLGRRLDASEGGVNLILGRVGGEGKKKSKNEIPSFQEMRRKEGDSSKKRSTAQGARESMKKKLLVLAARCSRDPGMERGKGLGEELSKPSLYLLYSTDSLWT